jgi:hypothetical protein
MSNGGSGQHPPAPASREIHPWCETRGHGAHSFAPGDRGFESRSLESTANLTTMSSSPLM